MTFLKRNAAATLFHRTALTGGRYEILEFLGLEDCNAYHDHLVFAVMVQTSVNRFRAAGSCSAVNLPKLRDLNLTWFCMHQLQAVDCSAGENECGYCC